MEIIGKYETIMLLDSSKTDEEIDALVEKFKSLIASSGTVESVDLWGKRSLAYEIDDMREGYYVLIRFSANPQFPRELDRVYRITDGVMRNLIIRLDDDAEMNPKPKSAVKVAEKSTEEPQAKAQEPVAVEEPVAAEEPAVVEEAVAEEPQAVEEETATVVDEPEAENNAE